MAEPLPGDSPITLYRGDTRSWTDVFERNTGTVLEPEYEPIDLSDCDFLAQIRATRDDDDVMAVMAIDDTDAADGVLVRTLTATEAEKLTGTAAYWDLEVTNAAGEVHTYLAGKVKIRGDVSRDSS